MKVVLPRFIKKYDFIVLDRYIYDVRLALSKEFKTSFRYLRRLTKVLPSPDLIFFIEVSPEVAYQRKKEELESIEKTKKLFKNYQQLYFDVLREMGDKVIKVNNDGELMNSKIVILNELSKYWGDKNER
ncbi:hypothetical protein A3L08_03095 [Thermococcus pacificus]|uniref:Thymidylate kinase-like domain-containing protein n=2 Tax=Thermococcus pacificus TaxID=71998 RepID=A0A218P6I7_9EURY|nr:hypothetical protein A3L08_03095 [Thermococcus pacificus]